jgi:urease accessory protein
VIAQTRLEVEQVAERSVVVGAHARAPLRLLAPRNHGHAAWVYQSSLGGGFIGDDDVGLKVEVRPGASLFLSSQSASKVYRSARSRFTLDARVGAAATLINWPDPLACFAGARLSQRQTFELDPTANLICVDAYTAGRVGSGERWAFDELSLKLSIDVGGQRRFTDAQRLSSRHGALAARLAPFEAFATVVLTGPRLTAECAALHRQISAQSLALETLAVSSHWPWGLTIRLAARSVEQLVQAMRVLLGPMLPALLGDDPLLRKW